MHTVKIFTIPTFFKTTDSNEKVPEKKEKKRKKALDENTPMSVYSSSLQQESVL